MSCKCKNCCLFTIYNCMNTKIDEKSQPEINKRKLYITVDRKESKFYFFYRLFTTKIFVILFGMFIGAGLVLKFNPEVKMLNAKIDFLQKENLKLNEEVNSNRVVIKNYSGEIKNSIQLP